MLRRIENVCPMSNMEVKKKKRYRKKLYPNTKEWEAIRYRMKFRSIIRRIVTCVIVVTVPPLLWYLCFVYYPLTNMVDIKGVIVEKKYHVSSSGRGGAGYSYSIKLDNYANSLRLELREYIKIFKEVSEGSEVIVQIHRKDLDKINKPFTQIPLYDYSSSQLMKLPRMYGIRTNEKVIITSKRALLNYSTPFYLSLIGILAVFLAVFFGLIFLGHELKVLYLFLRNRKPGERMVGHIKDPEGYVNIRKERSAESEILGKIEEKELFFYWESYGTDWWYVKTKGAVKGFVHKSRIREERYD